MCLGDSGALSKSKRACEEISKQIQEKFTEKMKENNVWPISIGNDSSQGRRIKLRIRMLGAGRYNLLAVVAKFRQQNLVLTR